jgi:hypothetical protein
VVRPGCKTGTRQATRRESAVIARVGWAGRAGKAGGGGGGGRPVAKFTTMVVAVVAIAIVVVVEEDILQTISIVTG